ncbi:MAG: dienelactone hydrolase [Asticcacaulis sp.]|uniref:dienelactone hydrolase family protein n=1 Tax=Asticcacaulis sp. TaxID=1872648 RepID=UPI0039E6E173
MDTLAGRFQRLSPHILAYGPPDNLSRPAILLFHGCGGIAENLLIYVQAAVQAGVRAYIIDSFAPRGWSRKQASNWVCKGLKLRGYERSGDVLAAVYGLSQRPEVDASRLMLAGWSHGAWAIMDLMTQKLDKPGDARLADPAPQWLDGVKGLFLVYPYINFMARSVTRPWAHKPKTMAILTLKNHLATYKHSLELVRKLRKQGVSAETVTLNVTHAFDEAGIDKTRIMAYDADALESTLDALRDFMKVILA